MIVSCTQFYCLISILNICMTFARINLYLSRGRPGNATVAVTVAQPEMTTIATMDGTGSPLIASILGMGASWLIESSGRPFVVPLQCHQSHSTVSTLSPLSWVDVISIWSDRAQVFCCPVIWISSDCLSFQYLSVSFITCMTFWGRKYRFFNA